VERVIQTIKHEILNGFVVVTNDQLDRIPRSGADWYNRRRGHSARERLPPVRNDDSPATIDLKATKIECYTELGGLLTSYRPAEKPKRRPTDFGITRLSKINRPLLR
jgi:putative transposase